MQEQGQLLFNFDDGGRKVLSYGNNDIYIGDSNAARSYVQKLADHYASYEDKFFVDILGNKISHYELDNFNTGDLNLGNTGLYYIGKDRCSACSGRGTESCSSCNGRGKNHCYTCSGSGTIREWRSNGEWRSDRPQGGYVNKNCFSCGASGTIRCNHCRASGEVTCRSCIGSGEYFYRFEIEATAIKKFSGSWRIHHK